MRRPLDVVYEDAYELALTGLGNLRRFVAKADHPRLGLVVAAAVRDPIEGRPPRTAAELAWLEGDSPKPAPTP